MRAADRLGARPGLGQKTRFSFSPGVSFGFSSPSPCTQKFPYSPQPPALPLAVSQPVRAMGSWESHLYRQPSMRNWRSLSELPEDDLKTVRRHLTVSGHHLCSPLQEPCQPLTVTGVAKVSRWLESVLLGPRRQKDVVLSTCCALGLSALRITLPKPILE